MMSRSHVLALLALPAMLFAHGGAEHAAGDHKKEPTAPKGRHGGAVLAAGDHSFEVIFTDSGLHVFPMDAAGKPLAPRGLAGKVVLRARSGRPETIPFEAVKDAEGRVQHLMARRDFSGIRDGSRKAIFQLEGLGAPETSFWTVLRRTPGAQAGDLGAHAAGSGSDHSMAGSHGSMAGSHGQRPGGEGPTAAQRSSYPIDWCLVSGDTLGSDGPPVELVHEGRLVRLCCKSCVKSFRADPGKYLGMLDAAARGQPVRRPVGSGSSRSGAGHGGGGHGDHGGQSGHRH